MPSSCTCLPCSNAPSPPPPFFPPLLQSTQCFLYEFWPELEQHNVTQEAGLQEELSKELLAACAVMVQDTRICYIRVDKVGWVHVGEGVGWEIPQPLGLRPSAAPAASTHAALACCL